MGLSAEAKWSGMATRLTTLIHAWLRQLKAAAVERSGRSRSRRMVLVESLSLGNRRQLFLVSCDEHSFLVGAGADRVGTVVAMPESTPDAVPLQTAGQQPRAAKAQAGHQRPEWMRDRSMGGQRTSTGKAPGCSAQRGGR